MSCEDDEIGDCHRSEKHIAHDHDGATNMYVRTIDALIDPFASLQDDMREWETLIGVQMAPATKS
jgi:hypothetical protein